MPAINFQTRFAPLILGGLKPHTIRPERKNPIKVLDTLYLRTGMRRKHCQLVAVVTCVQVDRIKIYPGIGQVMVNDRPLTPKQVKELAERDGFDEAADFFDFFHRYSGDVLENQLRLIWWDDAAAKRFNKEMGWTK